MSSAAADHPERLVLDFDGTLWTRAALVDASERCAAGLAAAGVSAGDVVCHFSLNDADVVITMLALVRLGAVECPVNAGLRGHQLAHVLRHSGAAALVADARLADRLLEVLPEAPGIGLVVLRGEGELPPGPRVVRYDDVITGAGGSLPAFRPRRPGDPLNIMYTSGTTGAAKGAVLPHGFPIEQARIKVEAWGLTADDVLFTALPLYHVNARFSTLATAIVVGGRAAIQPSFSAGTFWDEVRRADATEVGVVGAVSSILMLRPPSPLDRDHRVRMMHGASGIPVARRAEFEERFGLRLVTGFAMTETGHFSTTSPDDPRRYEASGRPVPQFDVAIVDDDDEPVPTGTVGELVVRPRRPHAMMTGYHRDPAATLAAFRNLWFHTGDLARLDRDGYLHWVDRRKDAIRRRGEMISSTELERVALEHPGVAECAALGVPAALGEEDVKLVVVAHDGSTLDAYELAAFCRERVPDFAAPRYIEVVRDLPKGPTHKVEKTKLRAREPSAGTVDVLRSAGERHGAESERSQGARSRRAAGGPD
jgi:crotonobetaine/carnitine-CoA ligase